MKRFIAIALILTMVFSLAACSTGGDDTQGDKETQAQTSQNADSSGGQVDPNVEKKIVVGIGADPESWGPWERFNNGRRDTMPMVYQTLTADIYDEATAQMVSYNVMITSWEKVADKTYELNVREGIYDTAGEEFTAEDAIFSFETCKEKGILSQLNAIDHLELVNELTFRIVTNKTLAVGDFEDLLTAINMVTKESFEASADGMATNPIGTTGYVMEEYVAGSRILFTKSETEYWNEKANQSKSLDDGYCATWDTTKIDTVQFEIITDSATMAVALETGQVDISASVSSADMILFGEGGSAANKFTVFTYADNTYALSFNASDKSPFENINLRKAVSYAIDATALLYAAYDGDGIVMNAWSYPAYMDYQKEWDNEDYYPYDVDTAKEYFEEYFKETGTKASDLHLRLLIQSGTAMQSIAQVIQSYVGEAVGNTNAVEILSYDRSSYNSMYEDSSAFDMFIFGEQNNRPYGTYAWNTAANYEKSGDGTTQWFVNSEELQALTMAAISDDTHSDATVKAFHEFVKENCYQYAMITGNIYVVAANWVKTLEVGPKNCLGVCGLEYDWSAKTAW